MISKKKMTLKKFKSSSKSKSYTIIIAPEKSGSSKVIKISKWMLSSIIVVSCLMICLLVIFISGYFNIKSTFEVYVDKNESSPADDFKFLQNNYIPAMTQNLKDKIKQIESLEHQLQKKLDSSNADINNPNAISKSNKISDIIYMADTDIKTANNLLNTYNQKIDINNHIPKMLPVVGIITSPFGGRQNPTSRGHSSEFHTGVDIGGTYGTPVHAAAAGYVEFAGWDGNYGKLIILNHGNGYKSYYGHNSKLLINEGDTVEKNQIISLMGSTGRSTGCHVHYEVRLNNTIIDPIQLINRGF